MKPINEFDHNSLSSLAKSDRYMLFKLDLHINCNKQEKVQLFYKMINEFPELEIAKIKLQWGCNAQLIKTLISKDFFKSEYDLLCRFHWNPDIKLIDGSENIAYISKLWTIEGFKISKFWHKVGTIEIIKLKSDLEIDWMAYEVILKSKWFQSMDIYSLGSQTFLDSV